MNEMNLSQVTFLKLFNLRPITPRSDSYTVNTFIYD